MSLLEVENLSVAFGAATVVDRISYRVEPGEILALVGESGCGKSAGCLALTGLLPRSGAVSGRIVFDGVELGALSEREMRRVRGGGIAYVFQEPQASLNPVFRIGDQIAEVLALHRPELSDRRGEVVALLKSVGIPAPESRISAFPHELSGGMQQRVMIAMALAGRPRLLVADEPTTALDVTIQAQIIELIDRVRHDFGTAVILVTHNLGIVAQVADRVAVMYGGRIAEYGDRAEVIGASRHPYTRALLAAVPRFGAAAGRLETIPGHVPLPEEFPPGCRFYGRCARCGELAPDRRRLCAGTPPELVAWGTDHFGACHFPLEPER